MQTDTLDDLTRPQGSNSIRPPWWDDAKFVGWYQKYLDRTPGPEDYAAHADNPNGMEGVLAAIFQSKEYKDRKPSTSTPGTTTPNTNVVTPGGSRTGWGFTSPTGGRGEFSYTDTDYGRDTSAFYDPHYRNTGAAWDTSDPSGYDSVKRIAYRTAAGLGERFDEAALDAWISRM